MDIIANPKKTNEILAKYDIKATKKFGQNFLIDANIVSKIATNGCDKDLVTIEIGPGIGSLTQFLLKSSKRVYSHEIDKKLINLLKEEFKDEDRLNIIEGDFLEIDFSKMPYYKEKVNICANLPYNITTPILFKLFESDLDINRISVMIQKEVAERFLASVNSEDYNALSVMVNHRYKPSKVMDVSRNVFNPKPKVDSTVISFIPKDDRIYIEDEKSFYDFVKTSFKQRRKTLRNNLKPTVDNIEDIIKACGFNESVRAQELSLEDFINIYEVLNESKSLCKD